ncbi:MAG: hypothetical protein LBR80_14775 [Deltaproteobacteria bacterium]|jgi:hypothetical protein|nr:hypothetical protein [Deltaproteobacteria bacterium]
MLESKITGDVKGLISEHLKTLENKIETLVPATKEADAAYANPKVAARQRVKSAGAMKYLLRRQIARLAHAARDLGPGVDPQRVVLLFDFDSATFNPATSLYGLMDHVGNSRILVAVPDAMGYSMTVGLFGHESEHLVNYVLTDLTRMGSVRAEIMLDRMREALGVPEFDVADGAEWHHGPYHKRYTERLAWAFERFLLERGLTKNVDALAPLELEFNRAYVDWLAANGKDQGTQYLTTALNGLFTDSLEGRFPNDAGRDSLRQSRFGNNRDPAYVGSTSGGTGRVSSEKGTGTAADTSQRREAEVDADGRPGESARTVGTPLEGDEGAPLDGPRGKTGDGDGAQRGYGAYRDGVRGHAGGQETGSGDGRLALDDGGAAFPGDDLRALHSGAVEGDDLFPISRKLGAFAEETLAAIEAGDGDSAFAAMQEHLSQTAADLGL